MQQGQFESGVYTAEILEYIKDSQILTLIHTTSLFLNVSFVQISKQCCSLCLMDKDYNQN